MLKCEFVLHALGEWKEQPRWMEFIFHCGSFNLFPYSYIDRTHRAFVTTEAVLVLWVTEPESNSTLSIIIHHWPSYLYKWLTMSHRLFKSVFWALKCFSHIFPYFIFTTTSGGLFYFFTTWWSGKELLSLHERCGKQIQGHWVFFFPRSQSPVEEPTPAPLPLISCAHSSWAQHALVLHLSCSQQSTWLVLNRWWRGNQALG